jgi:3-methyladenine DNA glycosylase/8-oxoguanine DNA glycosylase
MNIELVAKPPFSLTSIVQSHGWARLPPFHTPEGKNALSYILNLSDHHVVQLKIGENSNGVSVNFQGIVPPRGQAEIRSAVTWMLALDDDFEDFYKLTKSEPKLSHVKAKAQGRLLRSPTLFEDTIKTVLTTNTSWSGTIRMTESLVYQFGSPLPGSDGEFSFPGPEQIAVSSEQILRDETRLGYRAPYILDLARRVDSGAFDLERLKTTDMPVEDLFKELTSIKGVGNYAAANLMMLLGHYEYLTIDSWAIKMVSQEFFDGEPISPDHVREVFEPWGKWKGLAYWLWDWSEN